MNTDEINARMNKFKCFVGCFAKDGWNPPIILDRNNNSHHSIIFNTDDKKYSGTHWIAMYITPTTLYYFDPLAIPTVNMFDDFIRLQRRPNLVISYKQVQSYLSNKCGQHCCEWIRQMHNNYI